MTDDLRVNQINALLASPRITPAERLALENQLAQLQPEAQQKEDDAVQLWDELMADVAAKAEARKKVVASNPESEKAPVATAVPPRQQLPSPPDPRSLQELQKLSPAEVSLWASRNPDEYLRLTTPLHKEEREPLFYKVMAGGKEIGRIDCFEYRELTEYYERALRSITACVSSGRHSRERKCDCWLEFRNFYHGLQLRDPNSSLCLATEQAYDAIEAHVQNVKKSDAVAEGFDKLSAAMSVLQTTVAQARPFWLDTRRPVGSKTAQRLRDEARAAKKLEGNG